MKRAFLTFLMAVMLTASLAACTDTSTGTNGNGNGGTAQGRSYGGSGMTGRSSGSGRSTMGNQGRYYADDNGDVFGGNDGIGSDIGRAAGDMMDGMGDAVHDMTH